jgi:Calcineurin-like phosphoesterase
MRIFSLLLLTFLSYPPHLLSQTVLAAPSVATATLEDGPYVLWESGKPKVLRVHQGRLEVSALDASLRLPLDGLPAFQLDPAQPKPARDTFPASDRIAAVSDIHGNYSGLLALLQGQGIIGKDRHWSFGQGHLVVVGDIFDRGPQVTEILWFLRTLERQAAHAGGVVHVVLGNHETMVLRGDLRYLHPKYAALRSGLLPSDLPALYGPSSDLGRWLRSLPAFLKIGEILFVHGGPSPALINGPVNLGSLNTGFRHALDAVDKDPLLGPAGPVWYRGLIPGAGQGPDASDAQVAAILDAFQAKILVIGHSTLDRITTFHGGSVFGIDAGLKDGKPGEVWICEGGHTFRGLGDGSRIPLEWRTQ